LAARSFEARTTVAGRDDGPRIVAPGGSPAFLASFPVGALAAGWGAVERAELAEVTDLVALLGRLGLRTLGAFAALPPADVVARFGALGARAHRLARGLDPRAPQARVPPPDLLVTTELDPPVDRVELAVFTARALAEELHERLAGRGLTCTRVRIEAETEHGESLSRLWRHERAGAAGGLTAGALADRVRWQLDGWLRAPGAGARPRGALVRLQLVPDEVVPDDGRQLGLWGGVSAADERAARGFARLQGLFGPEAVTVPVPAGGRSAAELVTLVPWGDDRGAARGDPRPPWPGRLPSPLPVVVHDPPRPGAVADASGRPVTVPGRGLSSAPPATVSVGDVDGGAPVAIVAWAGPWPVDERWWDLGAHRRRARFQLLTAGGSAYLAVLEAGSWWVEATYG
jgi:protein ImuB